MRGFRKSLALFLAAILLLGAVPVSALEEGADETRPPTLEEIQETDGTESGLPEESQDTDAVQAAQPEGPQDAAEEPSAAWRQEEANPASFEDAVIYNLLDYNVLVLPAGMEEAMEDEAVYDAIGSLMMETPCAGLEFFETDGSFVISLPDEEPFFPYEVQFRRGETVWTEWFETEGDTVTTGGHTFSLALKEGASPRYADGSKADVRAFLAKNFTADGSPAQSLSMQPLDTERTGTTVYKFPDELRSVRLNEICETVGIEVAEGAKVAWAMVGFDDRFTVGDVNQELNLLEMLESSYPNSTISRQFYLELIVGDGNQFTTGNKRYIVTIATSESLLSIDVLGSSGGTSLGSSSSVLFYYGVGREEPYYSFFIQDSQWPANGNVYLRMSPGSALNNAVNTYNRTFTYTVYRGFYTTEEAAKAGEDVTAQIWGENAAGYLVNVSDGSQYEWANFPKFTVVVKEDGKTVQVQGFGVAIYRDGPSVYPGDCLYSAPNGSNRVTTWRNERLDGGIPVYVYRMLSGNELNESYYFKMEFLDPDGKDLTHYVASATANGQAVSLSALFSSGYQANFSQNPVTFTVTFTQNYRYNPGGTMTFQVKAEEAAETGLSSSAALTVTGAYEQENASALTAYLMDPADDGYYQYGYQTVFLTKDGGEVPSTIYPRFNASGGATVYLGNANESGSLQTSGESSVEFDSGKPLQYSVYAENEENYRNYWVTFVSKQTGGPKLFVNGATNIAEEHKVNNEVTRLVLFDDAESFHDLFLANIGDEVMENLFVRLDNAVNVKLDDYWTIHEGDSLRAFPDSFTRDAPQYNDLQNMAKVRLTPIVDANTGEIQGGNISGTLTIGYRNSDGTVGEEVRIQIVGVSGDLAFTSGKLRLGVKWVPYATAIQNNIMLDASSYRYSRISGRLPDGITLTSAGELYGITSEVGNYPFTIRVEHTGLSNFAAAARALGLSESEIEALTRKLSAEVSLTLTILDNTDDNVVEVPGNQSYGYEILKFIGTETDQNHFEIYRYEDLEFQSAGPFEQFANFYLDGELVAQAGYDARSGSTIITVHEQTFRNAGTGKHTIAAEFFTNSSRVSTMRTSAQNYYVNLSGDSGSASGTGSGSGSGGSSTRRSSSSTQPVTVTQTVPQVPFLDIPETHTFFADIKWAYDNGLMIGVSSTMFSPGEAITPGAIVTILARMAKVDLDQYAGIEDEEIPSDAWYAPAAVWARQSDLLPEEGAAVFQGTLKREQMAIMLVKYLKLVGADPQPAKEPRAFADADQMSEAGNEAFQVLYEYGIFKGRGNGVMDPGGVTNRGQFAAIIHRASGMISAATANKDSAQ